MESKISATLKPDEKMLMNTSTLLSRVSAFLPQIDAANETLKRDLEAGDGDDYDDKERKRRKFALDSDLKPVQSDEDDEQNDSCSDDEQSDSDDDDDDSSSSDDSDSSSDDDDESGCKKVSADDDIPSEIDEKKGKETTSKAPTIVFNLALGNVDANPAISLLADDDSETNDDDDDQHGLLDQNENTNAASKTAVLDLLSLENTPSEKKESQKTVKVKARGPLITEMD